MANRWTQEDLDRLNAVISSGAKATTYQGPPGRSFEAHSLKEMLELRAQMVADIEGDDRAHYSLVQVDKGF